MGTRFSRALARTTFAISIVVLPQGMASATELCGEAAWYAAGGITASGEPNKSGAMTAAHRSLPFGTKVKVLNRANGKSVTVRINDRGGFSGNRIIDVSRTAAEKLGFIRAGVADVQVTVLGDVGSDLKGMCNPASVALSAMPADQPEPAVSDTPPELNTAMRSRFSLAFQPESWAEFEMKKALEALLPAYQN